MTESRKDRSALIIRILPLLLVAAVVLFFYVRHRISDDPNDPSTASPPTVDQEAGTAAGASSGDVVTRSDLERRWIEVTGLAPEWPDDFDRPADCEAVAETLAALCGRLDDRPHVRAWNLPDGTLGLLTAASRDLAERPPAGTGVFRSLDAVRANVTHLFRVLGRTRLPRLARIAREESDLAEPFALALYRWALAGEDCEEIPGAVGAESRYEYAFFLTQTVGGQAYLRRRPPRLEALASFYSLLILDDAVTRGYNPHGVDLRPEIRRCRQLMESGGLLFRDRYVALLDDMARRWNRRTGR